MFVKPERIRVLIIEDNADDVEHCLYQLDRDGYQVESKHVDDAEQLVAAVNGPSWDIVLSDYSMPQFNALSALFIVRQFTDIPFIVVTGTLSEETAVECLKSGADDYILKENLARLAPAVTQALRAYDDRCERAKLEEQLRQSQKLEAVGKLSAGVAHDFNNMLAAIMGYTALARKFNAEPDRVKDALKQIDSVVSQGVGLTRSLLTLSRKTRTVKATIDLVETVDEAVSMLRQMIPASVEILTDLDESGAVWVRAEKPQLQQIVLNLMVNARDAMPDGGIITVSAGRWGRQQNPPGAGSSSSGPAAAFLAVEDNGTGMTAEVRSRLFEPFFTTKAHAQGTGLGMSIVQSIVNDHGGDIEVDSRLGGGTRVSIFLPRDKAGFPREPGKEPTARAIDGAKAVILVAEDNVHVRRIIEMELQGAGFEATMVGDGSAAMTAFARRADEIRAAVLDVDLPKKSGLDCMRAFRKTRPDLPVVVISGKADRLQEIKKDPLTFVLCKPFPMSELLSRLGRALASSDRSPG